MYIYKMYDDNDEMILVEADFEIIKNLTNKIDKLDENLEKLININNEFISKMKLKEKVLDKNVETNNLNGNKNKSILINMNLNELKKVCKDNNLKKYSNMKKKNLIDYIINNMDLNMLKLEKE